MGMEFKLEKIFLIMSRDGKLVAKGTPRNRYIHHIDEKNKKRLLTYRSKGVAESAFKNCGFYVSPETMQYVKQNYPHLQHERGYIHWQQIEELFEAKEFMVTYTEV